MELYSSCMEYYNALEERSVLPPGFLSSAVTISFEPEEKPIQASMNLSLIHLEEETPLFGAVFTRNRFPGAPVLICRRSMAQSTVKGILINNKIANVCAPDGIEDAENLLSSLGELTHVSGNKYLPASTGIIGWKLPKSSMTEALPGLVSGLQGKTILPVAEAIMTTDSFPKIREKSIGGAKILGIAKGAGMIEPNMGTMLAFILTDAAINRDNLQEILSWCVDHSFNRISIDGDQSTSDMVICISSGKKAGVRPEEFKEGLLSVCSSLAEDIVRNGEGVGHVIKVRVSGEDEDTALGAGKAIINSPLVKTAIFGNDPNVGRIISSLGDYLGKSRDNSERVFDPCRLTVLLGGEKLFCEGKFVLDKLKEEKLIQYLLKCSLDLKNKSFPEHNRLVHIEVNFGKGEKQVEVLGADLSYEYIRENAEYRS